MFKYLYLIFFSLLLPFSVFSQVNDKNVVSIEFLKNNGSSRNEILQVWFNKTSCISKTKDLKQAAIASSLSAEIYGLDVIQKNIEKGIHEGLYRKDIENDLITKFYFSLVMSVHDTNLHKYNKNTINSLEVKVLDYHTRAIATSKGIKILEEQLKENIN